MPLTGILSKFADWLSFSNPNIALQPSNGGVYSDGIGQLKCPDMLVHLLKSKIHRAQITAANVDYEGSLTIDRDLMDRIGLHPYERILCSNMANAARFETYAISGDRGSGQIILNGAAALLGKPGDRLTIMSFTEVDEQEARNWKPRVIVLGPNNSIINEHGI
jgi:aspartate 1-decarboxylase